jgi:hypothetical protein
MDKVKTEEKGIKFSKEDRLAAKEAGFSKWLHWRFSFSAYYGSWNWEEIPNEWKNKDVKEMLEERGRLEYYWSEHYRGAEWDIYDAPPGKVLQAKFNTAVAEKKLATDHLKKLMEFQQRVISIAFKKKPHEEPNPQP